MPSSTEVREIKSSRKKHACSWCPETIQPGESYSRYRYYGSEGAGTVKLHPECSKAMHEVGSEYGYGEEFYPGENPRGCTCGFTRGCEKCESLKNGWYRQQIENKRKRDEQTRHA